MKIVEFLIYSTFQLKTVTHKIQIQIEIGIIMPLHKSIILKIPQILESSLRVVQIFAEQKYIICPKNIGIIIFNVSFMTCPQLKIHNSPILNNKVNWYITQMNNIIGARLTIFLTVSISLNFISNIY